jgi:hypothetical protein
VNFRRVKVEKIVEMRLEIQIPIKVPFPRSYWVIPGKILAGYYPGSKDPKEATTKLTALINAGIRHVINLMEADERDFTGLRFVPYDDMMASIAAKMRISVTFDQLPIKDLSVPSERHMKRILDQIDMCIKHGKPLYVHCLGGIGRTGTVVGCYCVRHDLATEKNVLDTISDLRKNSEDSNRRSPETREQREMVVGWQE